MENEKKMKRHEMMDAMIDSAIGSSVSTMMFAEEIGWLDDSIIYLPLDRVDTDYATVIAIAMAAIKRYIQRRDMLAGSGAGE